MPLSDVVIKVVTKKPAVSNTTTKTHSARTDDERYGEYWSLVYGYGCGEGWDYYD